MVESDSIIIILLPFTKVVFKFEIHSVFLINSTINAKMSFTKNEFFQIAFIT